jgi:hypothetical protein
MIWPLSWDSAISGRIFFWPLESALCSYTGKRVSNCPTLDFRLSRLTPGFRAYDLRKKHGSGGNSRRERTVVSGKVDQRGWTVLSASIHGGRRLGLLEYFNRRFYSASGKRSGNSKLFHFVG